MGFFKKAIFSMAKEMDKQRRKDYEKSLKQQDHDNKRRYYHQVAGDKFDEINEIIDECNEERYPLLDLIIEEEDYYVQNNNLERMITILKHTKSRLEIVPKVYDLPTTAKRTFEDGVKYLIKSFEYNILLHEVKLLINQGIIQMQENRDNEELIMEIDSRLDELPNLDELSTQSHDLHMAFLKHYEETMNIIEQW